MIPSELTQERAIALAIDYLEAQGEIIVDCFPGKRIDQIPASILQAAATTLAVAAQREGLEKRSAMRAIGAALGVLIAQAPLELRARLLGDIFDGVQFGIAYGEEQLEPKGRA